MDFAVKVESLEKAIGFAGKFSGTDKLLAFDGAVGGFNVSRGLAEEMFALAPSVSKEVDEKLMPRWLKQRGIEPLAA